MNQGSFILFNVNIYLNIIKQIINETCYYTPYEKTISDDPEKKGLKFTLFLQPENLINDSINKSFSTYILS